MSWAQHCERGQVTCPHCRKPISLRLLPGRGGAEVPRLTMASSSSEATTSNEVPAEVPSEATIVSSRPRGRPPHDPLTGIPMVWDPASGAYRGEQGGGEEEEEGEEEEGEFEVEVVPDFTEALEGHAMAEVVTAEVVTDTATHASVDRGSEAGSSQDPLPGTLAVRPSGRAFRSWTLTPDPKVCKACHFLWPANTVTINVREQSIKNCDKYGAIRETCRCEQKFARLMAKAATKEDSETLRRLTSPPPPAHTLMAKEAKEDSEPVTSPPPASGRCPRKRSLEPRSEEEAERMLKRALQESMTLKRALQESMKE